MERLTHFYCDNCKQIIAHHSNFTTGYGYDKNGIKNCYKCCAISDKREMVETGKATMYLVGDRYARYVKGRPRVTNWSGSLSFPVISYRKGKHNLSKTQTHVKFLGPDGCVWSGRQVGEMTDLCHCKRTKIDTRLFGIYPYPK